MTSNYPPGVTGNEWQIVGPSPEWEALVERTHEALVKHMTDNGAVSPEVMSDDELDELDELVDRIALFVEKMEDRP